MVKLFGTDGVRGKVNSYPIDSKTMTEIGSAIGLMVGKSMFGSGKKVLIGRDTRSSCNMIESALLSGLLATGIDVECLGVIPTPAVALLARLNSASIGIMVSASHNPHTDNGIKLFNGDGIKPSVEIEEEIENLIFNGGLKVSSALAGAVCHLKNAEDSYIDFLVSTVSKSSTFKNMKVVLDTANGAAYNVASKAFEVLGANVIAIGNTPDGKNINYNCGSMHPNMLSEVVVKQNADLGFAFDGDGDRVLMCDENGHIKSGDQILASIATHRKKAGRLNKNLVVGTVMSGICFEEYLNSIDINLIRTSIGDRSVSESMRQNNCDIGGEASGHIVLSEYSFTGDGILTAIQLCSIISDFAMKASSVCNDFIPFPRMMINIACSKHDMDSSYYKIFDLAKEVELNFDKKRGRILVRKSGTENVIRIMVESEDALLVDSIANRFNLVIC